VPIEGHLGGFSDRSDALDAYAANAFAIKKLFRSGEDTLTGRKGVGAHFLNIFRKSLDEDTDRYHRY
jgi:hypothetical protein